MFSFQNDQKNVFTAEASKQRINYEKNKKGVNKLVRKVNKAQIWVQQLDKENQDQTQMKTGASNNIRLEEGSATDGKGPSCKGPGVTVSNNIPNASNETNQSSNVNICKPSEKSSSGTKKNRTKDVVDLENDLDALLEQEDSLAITTRIPMMEAYRLATSKKPETPQQNGDTHAVNATPEAKTSGTDKYVGGGFFGCFASNLICFAITLI